MKIDARELRVGNLVKDEETIHVVVGIDQWHVYSYWQKDKEKETLYKTPINQIKPIQLTEEWLLRFGKIEWLLKDAVGFYFLFNNKKRYLKFVHSVQNVYFYIEQKELICDNI